VNCITVGLLVTTPIFLGCEAIKATGDRSSVASAEDTLVQLRVASVGGCDKMGTCGVRLSDGSFGLVDFPSVDLTVCRGGNYGESYIYDKFKYYRWCK